MNRINKQVKTAGTTGKTRRRAWRAKQRGLLGRRRGRASQLTQQIQKALKNQNQKRRRSSYHKQGAAVAGAHVVAAEIHAAEDAAAAQIAAQIAAVVAGAQVAVGVKKLSK